MCIRDRSRDGDTDLLSGMATLERAIRRRSFDFGTGVWREGDPCPLCGLGEFGAEHLLVWCPA
eukprot:6472339-Alexandrium_andersonii.AAC.1